MLVISRKIGESLILGDNIRINVASVSGDKVTIAIDAPKEVKIVREELLETIQANKDSSEKIEESTYGNMAQLIKAKKTL
jgi:carbon storage regulator